MVVGSIPTLVRVFLCSCVGPFPSVGLTLTWFIWDWNLALHITLYSVNSHTARHQEDNSISVNQKTSLCQYIWSIWWKRHLWWVRCSLKIISKAKWTLSFWPVLNCLFTFPDTLMFFDHAEVPYSQLMYAYNISKHTPDLSNRTKPNKKPVEPNRTPIVRLGSAIEQNRTPILLWVRFSNQSNKIEQNRTNPMQLSLDASNWVKHVEYIIIVTFYWITRN